jgi:acyl-homoserine-lactone acylase
MSHVRAIGLAVVVALLPACAPQPTEILWDDYGIPHIFAATDEALFHAFGWAQMNNHANLVLRLYGEARGRAAEYWGEEALQSDWWVRTMDVPGRAAEWYEAQDSEVRGFLDAFAEGMNAWAEENGDRIDASVRRVLPVEPTDVLAHLQRIVHFTFVSNPGLVPQGFAAAALAAIDAEAAQPASLPGPTPSRAGSNAWAIAPERSMSGNALLLANPHLPWRGLFTWFEAQLTSPGVDAYGAVLVGLPLLPIAFNDHLGWTHTVNTYDGADVYLLELDGTGYVMDGETRPFEVRAELLKIRQEGDLPREEWLNVRESVHGPVIGETVEEAVALRVAGLDASQVLRQSWDMLRARDLESFEAAMAMLQLPMFTTIYADRDGNILHLFNGRVPEREAGDFTYWQGLIPGATHGTLWDDVHQYEELPRVLSPESGWLQNANDPPWTTTLPRALDPRSFPDYMAPRGMAFRPQRSARMLREDEALSFEELVTYKHSTRIELADRLLPELLPLARTRGSPTARNAADVLERWDRLADADSRGAVLFLAWAQELSRRSGGFDQIFAHGWDPDRPLETPNGLANADVAVSALEAAAAAVRDRYGQLAVAFGHVYRLQRDDLDLPGNGFADPVGVFRAAWYRDQGNGRFEIMGGDSYVAAVEFSDPVRAMALIGYGNASQPGSPHRTDQLRYFSGKELRPVWRTRSEIEAHLEDRTVF